MRNKSALGGRDLLPKFAAATALLLAIIEFFSQLNKNVIRSSEIEKIKSRLLNCAQMEGERRRRSAGTSFVAHWARAAFSVFIQLYNCIVAVSDSQKCIISHSHVCFRVQAILRLLCRQHHWKGEKAEGRLPADWLGERASECVCVVATHKENFPLGYTGKLKSYSPNEYIRTTYSARGPTGRLAENNAACALNNMQGGEQKKLLLYPPIAIHPHSNNGQFISAFLLTAISALIQWKITRY